MKYVWATAVALTLSAGGASAQSMDDWTGFYVGVVGGSLTTDDDEDEAFVFDRNLDGVFTDTVTTTGGADAFSPGFCDGSASGVSAASGCDDDKEGVEGGFRLGYDYQWGGLVVGAVGEYVGAQAEDSVTAFSTTPASYTFKRSLQDVAAARLRLGYAFYDRALVYATGGYARAKVDNRFFSSNTTNLFTTTSEDEQDLDGWQAGGGVEYRLAPRLSVIAEYLYSSFDVEEPFIVRVSRGGAPATNPFILPPNTTGTDLNRTSDEFKTQAFRIGLAYRF